MIEEFVKSIDYDEIILQRNEDGYLFIKRKDKSTMKATYGSFTNLISHLALRWGLISHGEKLKIEVKQGREE